MKITALVLIWIMLTILLSFFGNWSIGFLSPFILLPFHRLSTGRAMIMGLLVGIVSWGLPAIIINQSNGGELASMIGNLLKVDSAGFIILLTSLIGGIGVSLGAWLASVLFRPEKLIH